jgi:hypothetical protein
VGVRRRDRGRITLLGDPAKADPAVSSAVFAEHLDRVWRGPLAAELGLTRTSIDALHEMVQFTAIRGDGQQDAYFVVLGAEFYDLWPPTAMFVDPETRLPALANSKWWPQLKQNPPWGAFHNTYTFRDGSAGQMICISFTAEYYRTSHSPSADAVWQQGRHTVSATITRIARMLRDPYYDRPSLV